MAAIEECVVVLDGANVACQKDGRAQISKLAAAIQFFRSLQPAAGQFPVKCVAFAPNFWLNVKPTPGNKENGAMETDDWALLNELVQKDHVILTPSQAHDDFYVIDYAVKYDGFIVTNDMFRDHVSNKRSFHGKRLTSNWVRSHCIDFTFVGREFMPNPRAMERVFNFQPSTTDSLPSAVPTVASSTSIATVRKSSLKKARLNDEYGVEAGEDDDDEEEMTVDHAGTKRSKNIDLSEVTYYKVPRVLLPMLHGEGGQTMEKFQEFTETYIVLPSHAALGSPSPRPLSDVLTLSIYGPEANRQLAVGHLDAFLLQMQQQYAFQQQHQYMPNQVHHARNYPQQQLPANNGNMAAQDDHMMEIDPY